MILLSFELSAKGWDTAGTSNQQWQAGVKSPLTESSAENALTTAIVGNRGLPESQLVYIQIAQEGPRTRPDFPYNDNNVYDGNEIRN